MKDRAVKPLTFLLILGITFGFAGSAAALSWETLGDQLCASQVGGMIGGVLAAPICQDQLDSEVSATEPDEVQFDIYENWATISDKREQFVTEKKGFLDTSFGMVQAKAKLEIIEQRKNGSTQAEAQSAALEIVDDYYTRLQVSTLASQEREVVAHNETIETINTTDNLGYLQVYEQNGALCGGASSESRFGFGQKNLTLYNGSQRTYSTLRYEEDDDTGGCVSYNMTAFDGSYTRNDILDIESGTGIQTDSLEPVNYSQILGSVESDRDTVRNNVINMTSFYYNEYSDREADNLSVSDELGPLETLITASTNYDTTGSYSYLALTQAQAGHASNSSYAFHVQWNNRTAWGQLFVGSDAFNGTLEVNKTYDGSDETVIFVHNTENGKATETDINSQFKILEMRDTSTSEEVNSTKVQVVDFYTDGVQDLNNQLDEARTLHSNVTECPDCGGGIIGPTGSWFADLFNGLFPDLPDLSADAVGGVAVTGSIVLLLIAVILG